MSGIIYKITCNETGDIYIGSTTQSLNQRMSEHKTRAKTSETDTGRYYNSSQIIKRNNFLSEIVEFVNYDKNKKLLLLKEREWIENLNCVNIKQPITSLEEKMEKSREVAKNKYHENPELALQKNKDYHQTDVGKESKARRDKKYREGDKREELLEKKREWSKQNREKTKEVRSAIHECSCGGTYTLQHKSRHEKTAFHLKSFNN